MSKILGWISCRKSFSGFEAQNQAKNGVFWPKIDFASTSLYTRRVSFGAWGGKLSRGIYLTISYDLVPPNKDFVEKLHFHRVSALSGNCGI